VKSAFGKIVDFDHSQTTVPNLARKVDWSWRFDTSAPKNRRPAVKLDGLEKVAFLGKIDEGAEGRLGEPGAAFREVSYVCAVS
jgi:hypothetical protein